MKVSKTHSARSSPGFPRGSPAVLEQFLKFFGTALRGNSMGLGKLKFITVNYRVFPRPWVPPPLLGKKQYLRTCGQNSLEK